MPSIQQVHYTVLLSEGCREICGMFMLSDSLILLILQSYISGDNRNRGYIILQGHRKRWTGFETAVTVLDGFTHLAS
jgi:hypothetical protein